MTAIQTVQKEEIPMLKFAAEDALTDPEARAERFLKLEKARLLGNGYKGKVKITFLTQDGPRKVETTVWEASEDQLILKGEVLIPIHSVIDVEL